MFILCLGAPMAGRLYKGGVLFRNSVIARLRMSKYYYFVPYPKNRLINPAKKAELHPAIELAQPWR